MGEKLAKPPLIEALCEFRFKADSGWDWTIPGRLYERIKEEFSERVELNMLGMEVTMGRGKPVATQIHTGPDKIQLKRPDGSAMVQVGSHLLVINQLKPYHGWEDFLALIIRILGKYRDLDNSLFDRIGLRYINQIALANGQTDIGQIITTDPPLHDVLDRPIVGFYQRYELRHEDPPGVLIHQTGITKTSDGKSALMVDLDFGSHVVADLGATEDVRQWLNEAHDRIYEAFRATLNPDIYEKMRKGTS